MLRIVLSVFLLQIACAFAFSADEIPNVKTMADLAKVKPVRTGDWEVRLGLGDGGEAASSWKLIYCSAKYIGASKDEKVEMPIPGGNSGTHSLGPVCYRLVAADSKEMLRPITRMLKAGQREAIYCGVVPAACIEECSLQVLDSAYHVIATRRLVFHEPEPHCWWTFAREPDVRREDAPRFIVPPEPRPACPAFEDLQPIFPPAGAEVKQADDAPLPGRLPMGPDWLKVYAWKLDRPVREGEAVYALTLSLEKDVFIVKCDREIRLDPDQRLLARWWVNDKPVAWDRREARLDELAGAHELAYGGEMSVGFGLPATLGELKPGDKVALQVLYTPGEFERLRNPADEILGGLMRVLTLPDGRGVPVPMLSNRIEFAVTADMLEQRKKALEAAKDE